MERVIVWLTQARLTSRSTPRRLYVSVSHGEGECSATAKTGPAATKLGPGRNPYWNALLWLEVPGGAHRDLTVSLKARGAISNSVIGRATMDSKANGQELGWPSKFVWLQLHSSSGKCVGEIQLRVQRQRVHSVVLPPSEESSEQLEHFLAEGALGFSVPSSKAKELLGEGSSGSSSALGSSAAPSAAWQLPLQQVMVRVVGAVGLRKVGLSHTFLC